MKTLATRPIILVDMDGVICDWQGKFDELLQDHYPHIPLLLRENMTVFKSQSLYAEEHQDEIAEMMDREGFYRTLNPIEGAVEALNEMAEEYEVFLCTAPYVTNVTCASEKMDWVREHLGQDWTERMIITSDKTLARGEILIDDKPVITGAMVPVWKHIVFDAPYNRHIEARIDRWADWRTAVEATLKAA